MAAIVGSVVESGRDTGVGEEREAGVGDVHVPSTCGKGVDSRLEVSTSSCSEGCVAGTGTASCCSSTTAGFSSMTLTLCIDVMGLTTAGSSISNSIASSSITVPSPGSTLTLGDSDASLDLSDAIEGASQDISRSGVLGVVT